MTLNQQPREIVSVSPVDNSTGLGMFVNSRVLAGTTIYSDTPLVSIQHTANRRFVKACQNCHRSLGGMKDQMSQIFAEDRFAHVDLGLFEISQSFPIFTCHCGEMYCSPECASEAYKKHHRYLCVAGPFGEAVAEFKYQCLSVEGCGDNLLLLGQLLAVLESRSHEDITAFEASIKDLMTYTNRLFEEVARPPHGQERDAEWLDWLHTTILESFVLLKNALVPQSKIFSSFFAHESQAYEICSRILSIFELNNIDIAIPTGLESNLKSMYLNTSFRTKFVEILREKEVVMRALWSDEARGVYEDEEEDEEGEEQDDDFEEDNETDSEHMHEDGAVDEMLEEIRNEVALVSVEELLSSECPNFHGTGFYLTVARTNHSCTPNVVMEFENFNSVVICKSLCEIEPNSELRMSYISVPEKKSVKTRQSQLVDYLFVCNCKRCEEQLKM